MAKPVAVDRLVTGSNPVRGAISSSKTRFSVETELAPSSQPARALTVFRRLDFSVRKLGGFHPTLAVLTLHSAIRLEIESAPKQLEPNRFAVLGGREFLCKAVTEDPPTKAS